MRHERAWTPSKDTHWTNTINTQSQNETALSSPVVDSVTEGLAIYPVPLLGTLLWNCPINQCLGEAVLPLLTVWPPEQLSLYFLLTCPQYDEDSDSPRSEGRGPGEGFSTDLWWVLNGSMQVREEKLIYRNNATFSGLNIRGVINTNWILGLFKPGGDETSETVNIILP